MSSTTPNLGLTKTTAAETIGQNWAASNDSGGNFDIIDTKMGAVGNTSLQAQVTALSSQIVSMPYFGAVQNKTISLNQTSGFYVADFSDLTAPTVTGRTFVGYVGFIDTYRAAVLGFGGQRCYYHISAPTTADATVKVYPMYI